MEKNLKEIKEKYSIIHGETCTILSKMEQKDYLALLAGIKDHAQRFTKFQEENVELTLVTEDLNLGMYSYFLQYEVWKEMKCVLSHVPSPLRLDLKTAHPKLILSENLTSVRICDRRYQPLNNIERFDASFYVLGSEGFSSGRHCWEVEVGKKPNWYLGVATESIDRKGAILNKSETGYWIIRKRNGTEYFAADFVF
ncbi:E3 ubiquitin-protein ligase TRIM69-like [Protopterus annectens]|uniref:E3 ubiquitin-protein ligase TRIM69-like n=1 Tax=Protopterus annectens TaxID=7888 RepID=UPI001CFB1491|nr:E3 ubiquitin-protein ligase TRIM69-like [Protopterus annectens]